LESLRIEQDIAHLKTRKADEELARINRQMGRGIIQTLNKATPEERKELEKRFPDLKKTYFGTCNGSQYIHVEIVPDKVTDPDRPDSLMRTGSVLLKARKPGEVHEEDGITLNDGGSEGGTALPDPGVDVGCDESETEVIPNPPPLETDDVDMDMADEDDEFIPSAQDCKRRTQLPPEVQDKPEGETTLSKPEGETTLKQPLRRSGRLKAVSSSSSSGSSSSSRSTCSKGSKCSKLKTSESSSSQSTSQGSTTLSQLSQEKVHTAK